MYETWQDIVEARDAMARKTAELEAQVFALKMSAGTYEAKIEAAERGRELMRRSAAHSQAQLAALSARLHECLATRIDSAQLDRILQRLGSAAGVGAAARPPLPPRPPGGGPPPPPPPPPAVRRRPAATGSLSPDLARQASRKAVERELRILQRFEEGNKNARNRHVRALGHQNYDTAIAYYRQQLSQRQ